MIDKNRLFADFLLREVSVEEALSLLTQNDISPHVIYDKESDKWAILTESIYAVYEKHTKVDLSFYFFTNKSVFKPTVREALLAYLWPSLEVYEDERVIVKSDGTYLLKEYLNTN